MTEITRVYWKRKDDCEDVAYISGYCGIGDEPSYGEVLQLPVPTEIQVTVDEDGSKKILSPPVLGARLAYRYVCHVTPYTMERLANEDKDVSDTEFAVDSMLSTLVAEAPEKGATRDNWWWYIADRFRTNGYNNKTPVSLMKKWKRGMMEIILEGHRHKDIILDNWDERIENHKNHVARNRKSTTSAHRKEDGDLVVLPRYLHFKSSPVKQIFRFVKGSTSYSRRAKHGLMIGSTRYKTPHGPAMSFKDGTAPGDDLSLPVRTAMCLLAWSEAPHNSSHAVLKGRQKFEPLFNGLYEELEKEAHEVLEGAVAYNKFYQLTAAKSALEDFRPRVPHKDMAKIEADEIHYISHRIDKTLMLIDDTIARLPVKEGEDDEE